MSWNLWYMAKQWIYINPFPLVFREFRALETNLETMLEFMEFPDIWDDQPFVYGWDFPISRGCSTTKGRRDDLHLIAAFSVSFFEASAVSWSNQWSTRVKRLDKNMSEASNLWPFSHVFSRSSDKNPDLRVWCFNLDIVACLLVTVEFHLISSSCCFPKKNKIPVMVLISPYMHM